MITDDWKNGWPTWNSENFHEYHFIQNQAYEFLHLTSESEVTQSCPTLCDPMAVVHQASLSMEILQARILEWIAIPFSRDLPNPETEPRPPALKVDS